MKPIAILSDALMITGFVFAVMLVVEHLDEATRGTLHRFAGRKGVTAYAGSVLIGVAPGCRGFFANMIAAGGIAGLALGGALALGGLHNCGCHGKR